MKDSKEVDHRTARTSGDHRAVSREREMGVRKSVCLDCPPRASHAHTECVRSLSLSLFLSLCLSLSLSLSSYSFSASAIAPKSCTFHQDEFGSKNRMKQHKSLLFSLFKGIERITVPFTASAMLALNCRSECGVVWHDNKVSVPLRLIQRQLINECIQKSTPAY